ncbi:MAG: tRNA preQ1(34) S-adenosylmethionine ribosyltransferase-isomerase QueA [Verrucomicrobia bacterium]|nr:MAG: tRNA preQ1(34) S-adenosylmethionine ribosyltransferase-isomerase QueA [Verrucomicrobiota bacterium]
MQTSDFDYQLPAELIAQEPAPRRDAARLLVVRRAGGTLEHHRFADLPTLLRANDLLALNDTRVLPARLLGRKPSGGRIELLLLEERTPGEWEALLRAGSKRPQPGAVLTLAEGAAQATLLNTGEQGRVTLRITSALSVFDLLERYGLPPLPPYIQRSAISDQQSAEDRARYQTVFAQTPGAVAAPTAGLHFTPELFQTLENSGIHRAFVTLHVGLGTFRPVTAERVEEHRMEAERYSVPPETAACVAETRRAGGRIVAVGSTSVRTLETVAAEHAGNVIAAEGRTRLFIVPPYRFRVVDALITNFHLPRSTLLMMVSAFAGHDLVQHAYAEAIRERYRFYSYGDAMLIL